LLSLSGIFLVFLLTFLSLDEFENVVKEYSDVFKTWEDEEDKFRQNLRELQKKRAETSARSYRRTNAEHKPLQDRLTQLGLPSVPFTSHPHLTQLLSAANTSSLVP
jgi:hypothetical protein